MWNGRGRLCDGPLDGGGSDGHRGCRGSLACGSNNCKKVGHYFHEKDDCCDVALSITTDVMFLVIKHSLSQIIKFGISLCVSTKPDAELNNVILFVWERNRDTTASFYCYISYN